MSDISAVHLEVSHRESDGTGRAVVRVKVGDSWIMVIDATSGHGPISEIVNLDAKEKSDVR